MSARDSLDPIEFAKQRKRLSGQEPVSRLARLASYTLRPEGEVRYLLEGHVREDGKPAIRVTVDASLVMTCQRCLGEMVQEVAAGRELVFVHAAQMGDLEDEEEDTDYLPAEDRVEAAALAEEEVILSLPMAPHHLDCAALSAPPPSEEGGHI